MFVSVSAVLQSWIARGNKANKKGVKVGRKWKEKMHSTYSRSLHLRNPERPSCFSDW